MSLSLLCLLSLLSIFCVFVGSCTDIGHRFNDLYSASEPKTVAMAGHERITKHQLDKYISLMSESSSWSTATKENRFQMTHDLAIRILLENAAIRAGMEKKEIFRKLLELSRTDILISLYLAEMTEKFVNEEYVRTYFRENIDRFNMKEVRLSQILLKNIDKAEAIRNRVARNPKEFVQIVVNESKDKNAAYTKGDIGFVRKGALSETTDQFAFSHPKGAVSRVIHSGEYYAIYLITDIKEGKKVLFDEIKPTVNRLARQDFHTKLIKELESKIKIVEQ